MAATCLWTCAVTLATSGGGSHSCPFLSPISLCVRVRTGAGEGRKGRGGKGG